MPRASAGLPNQQHQFRILLCQKSTFPTKSVVTPWSPWNRCAFPYESDGWTDAKIAEALDCRKKTVENVRKRFEECGFEQALNGKTREKPPVEKLLDGEQEARVIVLRLGESPNGFGKWTLRLLRRKVVELEIAESVSYQTIRRNLKKQDTHQPQRRVLGDST